FLLVTIDAMSPRVDHHPDAAEDDGHDGDGDDDDDDDDDGVTGRNSNAPAKIFMEFEYLGFSRAGGVLLALRR
ncbi:unnamed protein product, partial [Symbiodinium sp. KB8]